LFQTKTKITDCNHTTNNPCSENKPLIEKEMKKVTQLEKQQKIRNKNKSTPTIHDSSEEYITYTFNNALYLPSFI